MAGRDSLLHPLALLVLGLAPLAAQSEIAQPETALGDASSVSVQAFVADSDDAAQPVAGWTFEPLGYALDKRGRKRVFRVGPEGEAEIAAPAEGGGVILRGAAQTSRGDLVSPSFALEPFRYIEVEVRYRVESGDPIFFACLRPTEDRRLVDLEFLPQGKRGKERSGKVRLHAGRSDAPYSVAVSITGVGEVRVLSTTVRELAESYTPPTKPLLVLDIRTTAPGAEPNPNFARVASVFGFPSVEYMHFTEFDAKRLDAIDPALVVLPGLVSLKGADNELMDRVVRATVKQLDAPVVGVCLGHQVLARSLGAKLERGGSEWGPTTIEVVKRDPVFAGLPRTGDGARPIFNASQSHNFRVKEPIGRMQVLASTENCETQVFRYRGKPWYTFQGHIERGWEVASPEACVLWKNMLRGWRIVE